MIKDKPNRLFKNGLLYGRVLVILVIVAVAGIWLGPVWVQATPPNIGSWSATTNYPTGIAYQSCVVSSGFEYCIAGANSTATPQGNRTVITDAVYFGQLSSGGVVAWSRTTSYPLRVQSQSCVADSGFVYCIGGDFNGNGLTNNTSAVYYASLSSSGVGSWLPTTNYPIPIEDESCVTSTGFVTCIAGANSTGSCSPSGCGGRITINSVAYFAALSSSGVGPWSQTTSYPTGIINEKCVAASGFVYCAGGDTAAGFGTPAEITNSVYFAPLSSGRVGSWLSTTNYPLHFASPSCVLFGSLGLMYCIGGFTATGGSFTGPTSAVYSAPLSSTGVGAWSPATNYPAAVYEESCVVNAGLVYCTGGNPPTSAVYFASTLPDTTSTAVSCSPSTIGVNENSMCTVTVTDTTNTTNTPTGTVSFASSNTTVGTVASSCRLDNTNWDCHHE